MSAKKSKTKHEKCLKLVEIIRSGSVDNVNEFLLSTDAADIVDYADEKLGMTALMIAIEEMRYDIIDVLLKSGCDLNIKSHHGLNAGMIAAKLGYIDAFKLLVQYNLDPNQKGDKDKTALHLASERNHVSIVEYLVSLDGVEIDCVDVYSETPLSLALQVRCFDACRLLLNAGADINVKSINQNTPLFRAVFSGRIDTIDFILSHQGELDCVNSNGDSPLIVACKQGRKDVAAHLLARGVSVNAADKCGRTPLMVACVLGDLELVSTLISSRAEASTIITAADDNDKNDEIMLPIDFNSRDWRNYTALMFASQYTGPAAVDIVSLLCSQPGVNCVNAVDRDRNTALAYACIRNNTAVVELLVERGADCDIVNADGKRPFDFVKGVTLTTTAAAGVAQEK